MVSLVKKRSQIQKQKQVGDRTAITGQVPVGECQKDCNDYCIGIPVFHSTVGVGVQIIMASNIYARACMHACLLIICFVVDTS